MLQNMNVWYIYFMDILTDNAFSKIDFFFTQSLQTMKFAHAYPRKP